MKGKIKLMSLSIRALKEGQTVVVERKDDIDDNIKLQVCTIKQLDGNSVLLERGGTAWWVSIIALKTLVIQYNDNKQITLDKNYWLQVILNGLVNTDKLVDFDIITSKSTNKFEFPDLARVFLSDDTIHISILKAKEMAWKAWSKNLPAMTPKTITEEIIPKFDEWWEDNYK